MPIKRYTEKEEDFFYLKVRKKEKFSFFHYQAFIQHHLDQRNHIPPKVFKKFLSYLIPEEEDKEEYNRKLVEDVKKDAIEYFTRPRMRYDFSIGESVEKEDDVTDMFGIKRLSFEKMLYQPIRIALDCFENGADKEKCIAGCFESIDNYTKKHKTLRKLYSYYKINVVAGYLAWRFGFDISPKLSKELEDRIPNTEQLNNAVKHCTEPYNTYPKKKKRR